ncbi:enolase C-terminal domain-like protein [uncultured Cohaesibacter sp.]|uniref:enolase C-terminal domain-like protein n=1 Tax=uncultured Cohaesibacter sp. TaxID=1002546 RepID=UPI00292E98DD|nr:enolase C-terminal domain-like protein [uncultured Cohaesibacter sp.]
MKIERIDVTYFSYEAPKAKKSPVDTMVQHALLTLVSSDGHEGYAFQSPDVIRPAIVNEFIRPILQGEDAFAREMIWQALQRKQRGSAGRMTDKALSCVDQAMWDLAGRALNQPVHKLIGQYRDKVPAYASIAGGDNIPGSLATPEDYARYSVELVAKGYKAIKLHSWTPSINELPDRKREVAACSGVREAVGPDIVLMLDGYHWYSRKDALYIGHALEELDFLWFEEPMEEASMSSYAWLSDKLSIPVIGPETMTGKYHTRAEWVRAGACDILRAGFLRSGGLTPVLKTAHLAEANGMNCELHGSGAASVSLLMSIPNCEYYERGLLHPASDYDRPPPYLNATADPMDREGFVHAPTRPGLGEDINLDYIKAHKIKEI